MSVNRVLAKDETFGGREVRNPGRNFELKVEQFTSTEQGVPIRLVAGTANCAGSYITPVFGFRQVEVKQEGGK